MTASRYIWIKLHGEIPENVVIRHKCDDPLCINPSHLEPGTQADNISDRDNRGKGAPIGEKNGRAILKPKDVKEIRESGKSNKFLANFYGVKPDTIRGIKRGRTWQHL